MIVARSAAGSVRQRFAAQTDLSTRADASMFANSSGSAPCWGTVMVRVEDAEAHCERARTHGARIVMEPTDFEYGERPSSNTNSVSPTLPSCGVSVRR